MKRLALVAALALVLPLVAAGATAPRIVGLTLDGKRLSLASLRGKPVIVNVWSSW